jgi:hypothetical protein
MVDTMAEDQDIKRPLHPSCDTPLEGSFIPDSVLIDEEKRRREEISHRRQVRERTKREQKRQQDRQARELIRQQERQQRMAARARDPLMSKSARSVLSLFPRYHYLTSKQIAHALGWDTFVQYAQKQLTLLTRAGYLAMENHLERATLKGSPEMVWTLTEKGRKAVTEMGLLVRPRIHHDPHKAQLFMQHTHAVSDVLIACDLGAEALDLTLLELWHDQDLKRQPAKVTLMDGTKGTVTADGMTVFNIPKGTFPILWEVDMGTEDRIGQWLPKIRRLMAYNDGVFQEQFRYPGFQVAIYVRSKRQPSTTRLQNLLSWTEDELTSTRRKGWGKVFRFTAIDPAESDPASWLTSPIFTSPFEGASRPLLEVVR